MAGILRQRSYPTPPNPLVGVGLAEAKQLSGPWTRCSERNPVLLHDTFVENSVVTKLQDGRYLALYDESGGSGSFSAAWSDDGLHWSKGQPVVWPNEQTKWVQTIRTPLCFIAEHNETYTVFFTAMDTSGYGCVGKLRLKLNKERIDD
jgi:hypothetical protein